MTKIISPAFISLQKAENICQFAFQGAQLDSFEVRSIEMVMTFMNSDSAGKLLQFRVSSLSDISCKKEFDGDFHLKRKLLLPKLYGLLGEYVSRVWLDDYRRLNISFGGDDLLIFSGESGVDYDPLDYSWHVDFDDDLGMVPKVLSLSCVISNSREVEFYERVE